MIPGDKNDFFQESFSEGTAMKRTVERRMAQQKRELSLAVVLSFTVLMFLITHLPRWVSWGYFKVFVSNFVVVTAVLITKIQDLRCTIE